MNIMWYLRRLRAMEPNEVWTRTCDRVAQEWWRLRYHAFGRAPRSRTKRDVLRFHGGLSRDPQDATPEAARRELLRFADGLLGGGWPMFAITRMDVSPTVDWHLDPKTGIRLPADVYAFAIRIHGEELGFDTKYVWELSRHHHTTVLAMAYWLTGEARYAEAAAGQVKSWIAANSFLSGVHWSSGIELGIRLISFVWVRRLLEDWPRAHELFESDADFIQCVYEHQWLLSRRMSFGSSANNHLIYEAAGLYIAACAMPWFEQSNAWVALARSVLEREFISQTFPEGYNRELASEYNGFVLEALVLCLIEGELCGLSLADTVWDCAERIFVTLADIVDCSGHPPKQGDGDDAHGLLLDAPDYDRWIDLLNLGNSWFGCAIPVGSGAGTLRSWLLGPLARSRRKSGGRTTARVSVLPEPGLAILRGGAGPEELYCVFDVGSLGYLSIAAHGHADALAIEIRCGGAADLGGSRYIQLHCARVLA